MKRWANISAKLGLPLIDPFLLVKEFQNENSEFGEEIREMLTESENKLTDEMIVKCTHKKMGLRTSRNNGWVITGFADSFEKASLLFEEQNEDEVASPHFAHIPTHLIMLEASDAILRKKAAAVLANDQEFEKTLRKFRKSEKPNPDNPEDETQDIFSFYDDKAVPSLIIPAFQNNDKDLDSFLGGKRDFGRPPEEVEAEIQEQLRIVQEAKEAKEKAFKENLSQQQDEWDKGDGIHEVTVKRLEKEDSDFLNEKARVLENYLDENVMDHVIDGLLELAKTRPANPIDQLAAFLFRRNRQLSK